MSVKIQVKRDTAANWSLNNPTLFLAEIGFETDSYRVKIGNGVTPWNSLEYFSDFSNISLDDYLTIASASTTFATKAELEGVVAGEIDLNATITTASAAAFASASAYTDQQIATIDLSPYLTSASASTTFATKAELEGVAAGEVDLNATITTASAAAFASASAYTDSELLSASTNLINYTNQQVSTVDLAPYITSASASSIYAEKIVRWERTYSFAGDETFTVTNNQSGAYVVAGVNNPTFNLVKGNTYTFVINASGHPFWIQTVSGGYSSGDVYSTGTTNLGTDNGTITWVIPTDAPDTLYYACQFHSSMQGTINLIDRKKIFGQDDSQNILSYFPGKEFLYVNGSLLGTGQYSKTSNLVITLQEMLPTTATVSVVINN